MEAIEQLQQLNDLLLSGKKDLKKVQRLLDKTKKETQEYIKELARLEGLDCNIDYASMGTKEFVHTIKQVKYNLRSKVKKRIKSKHQESKYLVEKIIEKELLNLPRELRVYFRGLRNRNLINRIVAKIDNDAQRRRMKAKRETQSSSPCKVYTRDQIREFIKNS